MGWPNGSAPTAEHHVRAELTSNWCIWPHECRRGPASLCCASPVRVEEPAMFAPHLGYDPRADVVMPRLWRDRPASLPRP